MSLIQQAHTLIRGIKDEQAFDCPSSAQREFAIAITAIEDASMRIARGQALKAQLIITPTDVAERTLPPQEDIVHPDQLSFAIESDLATSA